MRRILFRADADPAVGTGDLTSLAGLSALFDPDRWEPYFMCRRHAFAEGIVVSRGIERVLWLDQNLSTDDEVKALNRAVEDWNFAAVVFEITRNRLDSYLGLTDRVIKVCVCFDPHVPADFDVVVNWDVDGLGLFDGRKFPKAELLLGPRYVLLPVEFNPQRVRKRVYSEKISNVLVAMGGADEHDLTCAACRALIDLARGFSLRVVLGVGYREEATLLRTLRGACLKFAVERNVKDMFSRYLECDFAVGTGGLTLSELAATRTRAAIVAAYEHQISRCEYFSRLGTIRYLGFRKIEPTELEAAMAATYTFLPDGFFRPYAVVEAVERAVQRREQ